MNEISANLLLKRQTYYLAVHYVDTFLSLTKVQNEDLQLVGVTSLFIASKMEEIYANRIRVFVQTTDSAYTEAQVKAMERTMLRAFGWSLSPCTYDAELLTVLQRWDNCFVGAPHFVPHELTETSINSDEIFRNYRVATSLLDFAVLDLSALAVPPRALCLAITLCVGEPLVTASNLRRAN